MSAESGIPTYRGYGGIWNEYKWQDYACQSAFNINPKKVLDFHELRRIEAMKCLPHTGHLIISDIQKYFSRTSVVTQNIDGMHQRAASSNIIELHGSLWRMKCIEENKTFVDDHIAKYSRRKCECGDYLRPDIVWFNDRLNSSVVTQSLELISNCDLFVSIGTSASVWPAAGYPKIAKESGARCIEINLEDTQASYLYDIKLRTSASEGLQKIKSVLIP